MHVTCPYKEHKYSTLFPDIIIPVMIHLSSSLFLYLCNVVLGRVHFSYIK